MTQRRLTLVLADVDDDETYARLASAMWMVLETSQHRGHVEHDSLTSAATLDDWWQRAVDERKWS